MNRDGLDALIEIARQHASTVMLDSDRALMPVFVLVQPDGTAKVIGCPWGNNQEKEIVVAGIKRQMRKLGTTAYSFITEAWTATQDHDYGPGDLRPAERPVRREVVIACATDGENTVWGQWAIERNALGECIALPRVEIGEEDKLSSWLANLL
jgi:hypothetical protein